MNARLDEPLGSPWIDDLLTRICVRLQLTHTQHQEAERHYTHVGEWLGAAGSPLAPFKPEIFPQGSLRIGTTVRPLRYDEYDLDIVCLMSLADGTDPVAVLNAVENRLRSNGTLTDKVERKKRCVRLNYATQFHLDILPARPDLRLGGTCLLVPDRELHDWKESNPKGYAGWFDDRSIVLEELQKMAASVEPLPAPEGAEGKSPLQLTVQLFKRWRDIRYAEQPDLAPISIVLTTLAGTHYRGERHPFEALTSVVTRIRSSIPPHGRLVVRNPANPLEDLSERWDADPAAYRAFVLGVEELSSLLVELRLTAGIEPVKDRLKKMFGADVAEAVVREQAEAVGKARALGVLRVMAGSGAITTGASARAIPVRPNTFYGE